MKPITRSLLLALLVCGLVGTVAALTLDVSANQTTCGNALLTRDTASTTLRTGDPAVDDFNQQSIVDRCGRLILRQRLISAGCILVVVGAMVARRAPARTERSRIPGDPIV